LQIDTLHIGNINPITLSNGHKLKLVSVNNSLWISQKEIGILLDKHYSVISKHIKEISNYVDTNTILLPQKALDGKTYRIKYYELEVFFNVATKARNPNIVQEIIEKLDSLLNGTYPIKFKFPTKEYQFKEILEKTFKDIHSFVHQFKIGKYLVDFYFPHAKLVVEYDENGHRFYKNDNVRENNISKSKKVTRIIRVVEGKEFEGLNKILKYLLNNQE